ncbi:MAG: sulfurtransferase-like selenium metabolism protein YedF [Deltaproteobacteria bacterium]|nr:sulfurtransferase-like selenium metabolism protein YedF [Deltaproteobacteria bacterium]
MPKVVDCRRLSCPQPVIETKQALEKTERVTIIVDNLAARDNVARFGQSQGGRVTIEEKRDGIYITIEKGKQGRRRAKAQSSKIPEHGPIVVVIPSDQMGRGEEELGHILIRSFLHALTEVSDRPDKMIFFNTGVKLTVRGSEVLEDLHALEKQGVEILICGTCLDYFDLKDKLAVGQVSNMYVIAETMLAASRLVTV